MQIWYRVSDLDQARGFYRRLGFTETYRDEEGRWASVPYVYSERPRRSVGHVVQFRRGGEDTLA